MAAPSESLAYIDEADRAVRSECGYFNFDRFAEMVSPDPFHRQQIRRTLFHHETKEFLYKDAYPTLMALLHESEDDYVEIWSDDYKKCLGTAGLGEIRRSLPYEQRQRIKISADEDKFSLLPGHMARAQALEMQNVIIVDDKLKNLQKAYDTIASIDNTAQNVYFILTLQSHYGLSLQFGEAGRDLPGSVIRNVSELLDFRNMLSANSTNCKNLWIIDFNHTLTDTNALDRSRRETVATTIYEASLPWVSKSSS